jgi:hypothetical protein
MIVPSKKWSAVSGMGDAPASVRSSFSLLVRKTSLGSYLDVDWRGCQWIDGVVNKWKSEFASCSVRKAH